MNQPYNGFPPHGENPQQHQQQPPSFIPQPSTPFPAQEPSTPQPQFPNPHSHPFPQAPIPNTHPFPQSPYPQMPEPIPPFEQPQTPFPQPSPPQGYPAPQAPVPPYPMPYPPPHGMPPMPPNYPPQGFPPQGIPQNPHTPYPYPHQPYPPQPPYAQPYEPSFNEDAARIRTLTIAVNSSKGGVGKTTFSKELAGLLATTTIPGTHEKLKVVLVDMDLDYGGVASALRLNHIPNITSWTEDILERLKRKQEGERILYTPDQFMPYLQTHMETGLRVLTAPILPSQALSISQEVVEIVIDSLRNYFDVLIIDTGNNAKDYTLVSLEKAQKTIIVSNLEVPTISKVRSLIETLKQIKYPIDKLSLVINYASKRAEIDPKDVANTLGIPLIGIIPEDPRVRLASNEGKLFSMQRDSEFASSIRRIGNHLVPVFGKRRGGSPNGQGNRGQDQGRKGFGFMDFFRKK